MEQSYNDILIYIYIHQSNKRVSITYFESNLFQSFVNGFD